MTETLTNPDTLTQPSFYETNKVTEVNMSFERLAPTVVGENGELPDSSRTHVILMDGLVFNVQRDAVDAFGHYIEGSKGLELRFAESEARSHEEVYAACGKDKDDLTEIMLGDNRQLNLQIRGEDKEGLGRQTIELLFMNTFEQMEESRDSISEIVRQVTAAFSERYGWRDLKINLDVNVYFRENENDAWDIFEV